MESLIPYLVPLLLLPFSAYLVFSIRKKASGQRKNLPPGSMGWPFLGENMELASLGCQKLIKDRMHKYSGHVFKTSLLGEKMAVLCGEQGNKFIFKNQNTLFARWAPPSLRKAIYQDLDATKHQEPKATFDNFQYDILKPDALKKYVLVMDSLAREHLETEWRGSLVVEALPSTQKYALSLACRIFMNREGWDHSGDFLKSLSRLTKGILSLPVNMLGTALNRAIKGGRVVRRELLRIVEERRREMSKGEDLLSKMVEATNEDGEYMSDSMIVNVLIGLLLGAEYELSSLITIVIYYLAELPHIFNRVLEEQMEIAKSKGPNELLAMEDLEKMKYTWNVVRECLRLTPPSIGGFSESTAEFTYAGFTIPKGWKVLWTSHSSHMNPDYFPEPEKFDPLRFEGSGPEPYTYVPFGGGARMCPGRSYTKLVTLVFTHNLVTRFRLEKVIPNEKMLFRSSPAPAHGLPLRLHPHKR
ncbi:beta-amyrin 6-beta-monooxygenase-like [Salvia splendens]|uniref:beta-amyrin 6-beta-monooxygenase-like n=1 Tax=Salvia splendens TaxID=180675 RepID=UPI001C25FAD0|nr:beta-amyrin 6-beta-monooxygenase-like [Salvia splendens]